LEEAERDLGAENANSEAIGRAASALSEIGKLLRKMGFESIAERTESDFKNWEDKKFELVIARHECKEVRQALLKEFQRHLFFQVPYEDRKWCEEPPLSPTVAASFPTADKELRKAGQCFAFDLHAAAVYHSIRALETGLVALAKKMGITLDIREWGRLISDIEKKINEKLQDKTKKTPEEKIFLELCANAALHFHYLKDAWRNIAMHEGQNYDRADSQEVIAHSKSFLKELADGGIGQEP
jgi:hypothetical protein